VLVALRHPVETPRQKPATVHRAFDDLTLIDPGRAELARCAPDRTPAHALPPMNGRNPHAPPSPAERDGAYVLGSWPIQRTNRTPGARTRRHDKQACDERQARRLATQCPSRAASPGSIRRASSRADHAGEHDPSLALCAQAASATLLGFPSLALDRMRCRGRRQHWSVACADSAVSTVAASCQTRHLPAPDRRCGRLACRRRNVAVPARAARRRRKSRRTRDARRCVLGRR
jgi:hypothetical protein